ncbi:MAG: sugar phosphate nucleotidyltransferase [Chitinophagaceae bacterium]|nr:sugar phosphate nucleotidyltransferase [Chitinophagaceae bacterium]
MKAMIFAAGLGTRFKPWTDKHPKALAPVNGKSLLQRNIEYLQQFGIADVVVNVHHFASQIMDAVRENNGWGSRVSFSDETDQLLDTGGGLLKARSFFTPGEPFITCNADILTNLNLNRLVRFHQNKGALISFGVMERNSTRKLLFCEDDRLAGWKNTATGEVKMALEASGSPAERAYSTVTVMEYQVFSLMEQYGFRGKFSLIDVYLALTPQHFICGYDHTGDKWIDVGRPESVPLAESLFP